MNQIIIISFSIIVLVIIAFLLSKYNKKDTKSPSSPNYNENDAKLPFSSKTTALSNSPRPKMALEYVAEYNLAQDGILATSHQNDASGYFTWDEANTLTMPTDYHLPTIEEWRGVLSYDIKFDTANKFNNRPEKITVNGDTETYRADYRNTGNGVSYGLRFKGSGNTLLAAYRYERVGDFTDGNLDSHLKVTARYLGPDFTGTVDDIANEAYWNSNTDDDVTRILPASGYVGSRGRGTHGHYWSATKYTISCNAWYVRFHSSRAHVSNFHKAYDFAVRPFVQA